MVQDTGSGPTPPRVVLVTGASTFLGGYLVARLAANPDIEKVLAVDSRVPSKALLRSPQAIAITAGVVEVLGGLLIAFNVATRFASVLLILFTLAATYYFHDFWTFTDAAGGALGWLLLASTYDTDCIGETQE